MGVRGETFERGDWVCRLRGCAHHVFAGRSETSEAGGDGRLQTARRRESAACGSALHAAAALCSVLPARQPAFAAAAGYKIHTHMRRKTTARRCGCTCNLLTRPCDTHSITQPVHQRHNTPSCQSPAHCQARRPAAGMPSPPSRT